MNEKNVTQRAMCREVNSLIHHHGLSFDEACQIVGLDSFENWVDYAPMEWLPTPECIRRETLAIQKRPDFDPAKRRTSMPYLNGPSA